MRAAPIVPLAGVLALASSECTSLTPPVRALPLETVQTVGDGRTGEQMSYARDIDGFKVQAGSLGLRRGLGAATDVSVEATGWSIPSYAKNAIGPMRVWSGHAAIKRRIAPAVAIEGGAGGGVVLGTPFLGPDVALIAAWENDALVPFVALRGAASVPLAATMTRPGDDSSKLLPEAYGQIAIGERIPLGWKPPRPGELRGSLIGGFAWTWFADARGSGRIDGLAFGGEITF